MVGLYSDKAQTLAALCQELKKRDLSNIELI